MMLKDLTAEQQDLIRAKVREDFGGHARIDDNDVIHGVAMQYGYIGVARQGSMVEAIIVDSTPDGPERMVERYRWWA